MTRVYVAEVQIAFAVPDGQDPDGWICDAMSETMRNLTCEPLKSGFLDWQYIEPEHDRFRAIGYVNCDTYDDIESELFARVSPREALAARYERALCDVLTATRREPSLGPHGEWGGTKPDLQGDYLLYDEIERIIRNVLTDDNAAASS